MKLQSRLNWLVPVAGAVFYIAKEVYEWLKPKEEPFDLKKQLKICQNICHYYITEKEWSEDPTNPRQGEFWGCERQRCEYYVKTQGGTKKGW